MCKSRTRSLSRDGFIQHPGLGQHFVAEVAAQAARGVKIHRATKEGGKLVGEAHEPKPGRGSRFELDQEVKVAPALGGSHEPGAKDRKPPHPVAPADFGKAGAVYGK